MPGFYHKSGRYHSPERGTSDGEGGVGSVVGESGVGDSGVKELGALGDKGGVPFACCNNEEATGEAGVLVVTVVVGSFPDGALDLKRGATTGNRSGRLEAR